MQGLGRRWFAAALLLACASACGGTGASYRGGVFQDRSVRFRVGELGPEWRRVRVPDGDLAFHRPGMGTISANATCSEYGTCRRARWSITCCSRRPSAASWSRRS